VLLVAFFLGVLVTYAGERGFVGSFGIDTAV
jgi:hypothetical protein